MIDNKVVGQAIAKLRQAENMTQQTLAACLNVSHQAVSKWENGSALPDVLTLLELSRMFGVTLEQLLAGEIDNRLDNMKAESAEKPIELKLDYTDINAKAEKAREDAEFARNAEDGAAEAAEQPETAEPEGDIDMDKIIEMAPFMSRAALDDIALKYNGKCTPRQLSRLAPFLSRECLEKLVVNCESEINWDTLRRLAPFLRKEAVDALTAAAAKGEKYTNDLSKQISKGIRKLYDLGDRFYHDTIKPNVKKVVVEAKVEKPGEPVQKPAPDRVSSARSRIFERALNEERFDWIGDHIDQLNDPELRSRIAARALELGMNDWLEEYMDDMCGQDSIDNAILGGNWDYISAHIEDAGEDALALIADTAASEGRWDWLAENIEYIAGCDDARAALIGHALNTGNLGWLGENLAELSLSEADCETIAAYVAAHSDQWSWLEAHIDGLEGEWANAEFAEAAYKSGHRALALAIIRDHLSDNDLCGLIRLAVEADDMDFASEILEYNEGDLGTLCIELAKNGHIKETVAMAEYLESDTIAALLDIASEQGDWELIDKLNDMLD